MSMTYFPGIADDRFIRGDIPMTKQEVRILVLAKACIKPDDIVVDIGAGTGSLSIEAALQARQGKVYAVEREAEGISLIRANATQLGAKNIEPIQGAAPEAMADIPDADVIFVGGSGGHLSKILDRSDNLLRSGGRLVITAVTIETLHDALHIMQNKAGFTVEAFGVQVTRIRQVASSNMLQALNPIYIIACTKGGQHER